MTTLEKYYLKACEALGKTPVPVMEDRSDRDAVSVDAYARLIICIAFKNMIKGKRWIPVYNGTEWHYFVRVWPNKSGSGFSDSGASSWISISGTFVGARLEYRTYELCEKGRKEFEPLYIDYFLMPTEEGE